MKNEQKRAIIESTKGKVFTATFTKKSGEERKMNCRLGVTSHLKGGVNTKAHMPQYMTVFDMQKKAYRSLNLDTLKSVTTAGVEVNFK